MAKACFSGCVAQYQGLLRAGKGCLLALKPLTHGFDAYQEHAKPAVSEEEVQLPMLLTSAPAAPAPAAPSSPAGDLAACAAQAEKTPAAHQDAEEDMEPGEESALSPAPEAAVAPVATAVAAAAASPCGTPANLAGRGGFVCCSQGPRRQEACAADAGLHMGQVAEAVLQGAWHVSSFLGRQLLYAAEAAKPHVVSLANVAAEKLRSSMERKSPSQSLPKPTSSTWEANSRAADSRADSRAGSRDRPSVTPLDLSEYDVCSESGFTSCRTTCPPSRAIDRTLPGLGSFPGAGCAGYDPSRDAQLRYSLNDGMPPQVLFQTQVPQSPFPAPIAAPRAAQSFNVQSLPGAQSFNTVFPQAQSFPALQHIQSFQVMAPGSVAVYHHLPQAKILRTTLGEKRPFTGTRGPLISRPAEPSESASAEASESE